MKQTISEIAQALGAQMFGDAKITVSGLAEPEQAKPSDLALAMNKRYSDALAACAAQAAVVWDGADWEAMGLKAALVVPRSRMAMSALTQMMDTPAVASGIHPMAIVDPSATLGDNVTIGPFCVIGADVAIGANCILLEHVSVGAGSAIGPQSMIHPGVRIGRNVTIGTRAIIQPNAVVGADGLSFVTSVPSIAEIGPKTLGKTPFEPIEDATWHRIHSLGGVVIGDDVEIGANAGIDAGTIRPTRIGRGTKIDNIVHVGHNVMVGEDCLLCSLVGIAGSTVIGDRTILGGKTGVGDNLTVGSDVLAGGGTNILGDIASGSFVMGSPAKPMLDYRAELRAVRDAAKGNLVSQPNDGK